ncbi:uncharacterized protein BXZ73DRAFT_38052 [Epithele typhae]|uniref:uncharacterized protein n=1 Tax=Epithele typhae TaxID=378194 RepID=UPI002008D22F|nr:uncharacterized protein BXZ73DRAFT_38052 [Epithele typhae]KAH9945381.1 hypothetical protein BXZ73DRAFT_38052 [Epithele typhae]
MTNVLRVPKLDLPAILVQQNPQIDLRLDAYETSTRNFLAAVSNYTQHAVTEITKRKNKFHADKKAAAEKAQNIETETTQCKVKEIELISVLDREAEEKKEAEASVAQFRRQLASIKEKCASLDVEIEQHRIVAANLMRERRREHGILNVHAANIMPEMLACEDRLKCWIEGIGPDLTLVRFTHIDPADISREFSLVLDVSEPVIRVPTTTPGLPTLPIILNESSDSNVIIRRVRAAFVELVAQGK